MSEHAFQFATLRYMHDPVTQEFLNVGIVVYSKESKYVGVAVSRKYARLSNAFEQISGSHYRRIVGHLERRLLQMNREIQQPRLFDDFPPQIEDLLARVLPPDDSSLIFGGYGGGLTEDLDAELARLYRRLVEYYVLEEEKPSRTDQEIWQRYRKELDELDITPRLSSVTIRTPTYEYEFDHAWKNERWHPLEAVSFDLVYENSILEKANKWIGRATMLSDSPDIGKLYLLLGAPADSDLRVSYEKAVKNLRNKAPLSLEMVEESDAVAFSRKLARMIDGHSDEPI